MENISDYNMKPTNKKSQSNENGYFINLLLINLMFTKIK